VISLNASPTLLRFGSDLMIDKKAVDGHPRVSYDPWQHWKGGDSKIYEF